MPCLNLGKCPSMPRPSDPRPPGTASSKENAMFDVFISYGHEDQAWVHTLAENLYRAGLRVFYDKWVIRPGDVLVHALDEGIRTSYTGVVVLSPASVTRPWVLEEYAAMLTRAV